MDVREGGGRRSRKRLGASKRKTRTSPEEVEEATVVTKDQAPAQPPVVQTVQKAPVPTVILAPAKKKAMKVMLVPKNKATVGHKLPKKTFKAKRVRVTIDNTVKTQKQRKFVMEKIEAMTEDQLRAAAVSARLSRRETVEKVPIGLLRQMMKDYQTMRGSLL